MPMTVYISGYTTSESPGIYHYDFDSSTGKLALTGLAIKTEHPSFLVRHGNAVYSTNEVVKYDGEETGYLSCFRQEKQGKELLLINELASGGGCPCHAAIDREGRFLFVSNYIQGTVSSFPLQSDTGAIGPMISCIQTEHAPTHAVPERQEHQHAHCVNLDPVDERYLVTMDLGSDVGVVYAIEEGKLRKHHTVTFPAGTGPRHITWAPGRPDRCYVIGELSNEIFVLAFDPEHGTLAILQHISALPTNYAGETIGAEITTSPDGRFLYASLRGHDSIAIFAIESSGSLALVGHQSTFGKWPRHFAIDPSGSYLVVGNEKSHNVAVFKMDSTTGQLSHLQTLDHINPSCILFCPDI